MKPGHRSSGQAVPGGKRRLAFRPVLLAAILASLLPYTAAAAVPAIGEMAPPFEAVDTGGQRQSLSELRAAGRTTILFFWSLRCAPCLREMAYLEEVYQKFRFNRVTVLGVESSMVPANRISETLEQLANVRIRPTFPIIPDPRGTITASYGIEEVPVTFIIGGNGAVVYAARDFANERKSEIDDAINALLFPRTPRVTISPNAEPAPVARPAEPPVAEGEAPTIREKVTGQSLAQRQAAEDFEKNRYFGDFYFTREEYDRALGYYEKCLAIEPNSVVIRFRMGDLFVRRKEFPKAREVWEQILRLDPGNAEADDNLRRLIRGDF